MTAVLQTLETPDGEFTILTDEGGRVLVSGWTADDVAILGRLHPGRRPADVRAVTGDRPASSAADAVRAYYDGDLRAIDDVAVSQHGTDLQRAGWDALRRIEPGHPLTYTGFAASLGSPRAVRAAAAICARNAPALFVPCHRVVRSDGSLGGFAWGLDVKDRLLAREAVA
ncbi:methylated-DNA--[protein]-cysteine S-methyltransferase [Microbacterium xanthum]|uniref:methylated-DNA--[protein]-cysteine S-methyltransferase n=1 Tax=Microbacterium xanthum TaxID=3079794 RepID=UPI002AD41C6A|nr:methylated-DNA--[protein]-cysteine S-methyltransferase [Microbacterium sp. KSW-48]MDZ8170922.1 methylated-DNA--[protein]-cysteine S-methyltransferase [Microbacterium sp. KSW-48]